MNVEKLVLDLCAYNNEQEWFEFKENWFQPEGWGNIYQLCQMQQHFIIRLRHILCGVLMMRHMKLLVQHLISIATITKSHTKIFWQGICLQASIFCLRKQL